MQVLCVINTWLLERFLMGHCQPEALGLHTADDRRPTQLSAHITPCAECRR